MKFSKKIGILGGMGPLASSFLYKKIIMQSHNEYGSEQDNEYPEIVLYSIGLNGFDETGIVDYEKVKQQLIDGVKVLEQALCDFIIVDCNTVHIFFDDMKNAVSIPVLHLIEEVVNYVFSIGVKKVGLITSETTNDLCLYDKKLEEKGLKCVKLAKSKQKALNGMILSVCLF